eukprot:1110801-Pleurochrysis_carterae.AAC.3
MASSRSHTMMRPSSEAVIACASKQRAQKECALECTAKNKRSTAGRRYEASGVATSTNDARRKRARYTRRVTHDTGAHSAFYSCLVKVLENYK